MTTIAWDGVTLASDKRVSCAEGVKVITKIKKSKTGALMGLCGDGRMLKAAMDWYENGAAPGELPKISGDKYNSSTEFNLIVIQKGGEVWCYDSCAYPIVYDEGAYAFGSGGPYARAAMALGYNAVDAVEFASRFDHATGNGVDCISFGGIE